MNRRMLSIALLSILAVAALADIYTWTDKNGVKHYSNDPPPKSEPVTGLMGIKESREDTSSDKEATEPGSAAKKVVIYVDPQSDYCQQALSFFDRNKIEYTKYDVTASEDEKKRFKDVQGQGTPLIFIGDKRMDGWNENLVREYLGMKAKSTPSENAGDASKGN